MLDAGGFLKHIRWVLILFGIVLWILLKDVFGLGSQLPDVTAISITASGFLLLFYILGQTRIFPLICKIPGISNIFPNIDGEYEVEIFSNWSIVGARAEGRDIGELSEELFTKVGNAKIVARLTRLDLQMTMKDKYSQSETVTCSLRRGEGSNPHKLFYVFDATIHVPQRTDSAKHLGAGELSIPRERTPKILKGQYWTNRNWHQGLNTAGSIQLRRISR